jgi:hypothetical protein
MADVREQRADNRERMREEQAELLVIGYWLEGNEAFDFGFWNPDFGFVDSLRSNFLSKG